jgi:FkbM family methyltransferase
MIERTLGLWGKLHVLHRSLRYRFRTEPDTYSFVDECVRDSMVALDVGAHKAVVTRWLSKRVGPTGSVVAFEPQPELLHYLASVKVSFSLDNTRIVPVALAEDDGQATLYRVGAGHTGDMVERPEENRDSISVETVSLDAYWETQGLGRLDFIKVDVDGFEMSVLKGARNVLKRHRPSLLVEVADSSLQPVVEWLGGLGYGEPIFEFQGKRYPACRTSEIPHRHENAIYRNFLFKA